MAGAKSLSSSNSSVESMISSKSSSRSGYLAKMQRAKKQQAYSDTSSDIDDKTPIDMSEMRKRVSK